MLHRIHINEKTPQDIGMYRFNSTQNIYLDDLVALHFEDGMCIARCKTDWSVRAVTPPDDWKETEYEWQCHFAAMYKEYTVCLLCTADVSKCNNLSICYALQDDAQHEMYIDSKIASPEYFRNQCLYAITEIGELVNKHPFSKDYKKRIGTRMFDDSLMSDEKDDLYDEYADILHFIFNIGIAIGIESGQLSRIFMDKHMINAVNRHIYRKEYAVGRDVE